MTTCKICLAPTDGGSTLCKDCSIAIRGIDETIEFLDEYLEVPERYEGELRNIWGAIEFLNFFLGMYNRYVGLKNLIFEYELLYLFEDFQETLSVNYLDNRDVLLRQESRRLHEVSEALDSHGILTIDPIQTDGSPSLSLRAGVKMRKCKEVFDLSEDPTDEKYRQYNQSISLLVMLLLIRVDLSSTLADDVRNPHFPRIGFFPIRIISGAIRRIIAGSSEDSYVTNEEILRSFTKTGNNPTKLQGALFGISPGSVPIFREIPDPDSTSPILLAPQVHNYASMLANRIRQRESREREYHEAL